MPAGARNQQVAERAGEQRHDHQSANPDAPRSAGDQRPEQRTDAADGGNDADGGRTEPQSSIAKITHAAPKMPHSAEVAIDARVMARRRGCRATSRSPTAISALMLVRAVGSGAGSGFRIEPTSTADTTNVTASSATANGPPKIWTRKPDSPKPVNSDTDSDAVRALLAGIKCSRPTTAA